MAQRYPELSDTHIQFIGKQKIFFVGTATVVHQGDAAWRELVALFPPLPGARQICDVALDLVQTSCGMAVPYLSYTGDRELLNEWAEKKGEEGLRQYRKEKSQFSLDDLPTDIVKKSGQP